MIGQAFLDMVREEDEGYINLAIENAMSDCQDLDAELFQFLKELLLILEGDLANTQLKLPEGTWRNVFSNEEVEGTRISVQDILVRHRI